MASTWQTADPADIGWDPGVGAAIEEFRAESMPWLQAIAVARAGTLVIERYWGGLERDFGWSPDGFDYSDPYEAAAAPDQVHNIKSSSKSIMSALVGIAVSEGVIGPADQLGDYLDDYFVDGVDRAKARIRVQDLITMRSGLEWDENGPITTEWLRDGDLIRFTLEKQLVVSDPGIRLRYSTADTHLLCALMTRALGMDLLAYAEEKLFRPLGFGSYRWTLARDGYRVGGSEVFLTLRDLLAFGRLFLDGGRAPDGKQLVPESWVEESTAPQAGVGPEEIVAAFPPRPYEFPPGARQWQDGYGMLWWRTRFGSHASYFSAGNAGQLCWVVPELDLVVAQFSSTHIPPSEVGYARATNGYKLVDSIVVPALGA